jgi:medium-chain acyl-[acyl-carrier-protein] hydrolase
MKRSNFDRWVVRISSGSEPRVRLFCFPYAGGGTVTYRSWGRLLTPNVEVFAMQLPGREQRLSEPPIHSSGEMTNLLVEVLQHFVDIPFALFGHSMGAVLAYETARRLLTETGRQPYRLFVSGHRAPHLPYPRRPSHGLPDAEFIAEVRALNGSAPEVFEHAELLEILLPMMRADFELSETYTELPGPLLSCPLIAFGGDADASVPRAEVEAWRNVTSGRFRPVVLPGNHFFINTARERVLDIVASELSSFLA